MFFTGLPMGKLQRNSPALVNTYRDASVEIAMTVPSDVITGEAKK